MITIMEVDEAIKVPQGYINAYHIRSSLQKSGITAGNSVGDSGFFGKLRFLLTNNGNDSFPIKKRC
jgi:deoxycytidine triphosphate deaminase